MTAAVQAGHVFRSTPTRDQGFDAEIEFKDHNGKMTGSYVYVKSELPNCTALDRGAMALSRSKSAIFSIRWHGGNSSVPCF
jgi:hypothetical protein